MIHTLRAYGNLKDRTWRIDEEPAPEIKDGENPWMLVVATTFEDEANLPYSLDLEQ